ncbi:hypothetical protein ACD661_14290 [Legionella lytica]|uniref:VrrB n=1 Tax=Legionella lytica TaxID=96232 RepID=A0ABW8DEU0_9GAMM
MKKLIFSFVISSLLLFVTPGFAASSSFIPNPELRSVNYNKGAVEGTHYAYWHHNHGYRHGHYRHWDHRHHRHWDRWHHNRHHHHRY